MSQQAVDTVWIKETVVEDHHRPLPNTGRLTFWGDFTNPAVTIVCVDGFR